MKMFVFSCYKGDPIREGQTDAFFAVFEEDREKAIRAINRNIPRGFTLSRGMEEHRITRGKAVLVVETLPHWSGR